MTNVINTSLAEIDDEKLDALWELRDEANQALKSLDDVVWKFKLLDLPSAGEAMHLFMKLRVVLHEAGRIAYDNDAQVQHEALDAQVQDEAE